MAIYTCQDMIADCRGNKPEGWRHFIATYVPALRRFVGHYADGDSKRVESIVTRLRTPGAELFREGGPATERDFIVELRQIVLNSLDTPAAEIAIDLDTLSEAVPEFTVIERQIVWLEAIGYDNPSTAKLMNVDAATVESA